MYSIKIIYTLFVFKFVMQPRWRSAHKSLQPNLAIKNKKGKQFKHTYICFGYLVEPHIEIWQCFTFFLSNFGAFKKSLNLQPKKIQILHKKEVGGSQYPPALKHWCVYIYIYIYRPWSWKQCWLDAWPSNEDLAKIDMKVKGKLNTILYFWLPT